jgi:hypothetical protein
MDIILTLSPALLTTASNKGSCVQADCLSTSTLRLTADNISNEFSLNGIFYWPSFEVFRWVGSNISELKEGDDSASWHVTEKKVNKTILSFLSPA